MHRPAPLLALLLVSALAACAADGTVIDPSGRPIPNARVECAGRVARTGPDGRFSFPSIERCAATVSAAGFQTLRLDLTARPARIELAIAALEDRVVVSATRRETNIEDIGAAATVLTAQDLELRQSFSVADLLQQVPGIQVARYGRPGSLTQVFGRGGQRTATLILVDGVPVNDPGGEVNLAGFSTAGLDHIEVVRGPESALFGAEAASGVIQLFTRRGDPERRLPHGSLSYERGSFQTDRWNAVLAGGSGSRFDYSLAAEQFHTLGQYANDYFRDTTGTANLGFRLSSSTQIRGIYRTFDAITGAPNQVGYGIFDADAHETTRDSLLSFRLDDVRGPHFLQSASFSYHRSNDLFIDPLGDGPFNVAALVRDVNGPVPRTYFEGLTTPGAPVPPGLRLALPPYGPVYLYPSDPPFLSLSSRKHFSYQGTATNARGAAVFGYEFERQDADVTGRPVTRDNHGWFLHGQQTLGGRLSLSAGARLEKNSAFGAKWTPRGAASYRLARSTYLRASAGLGITDPSLLQNYYRDPYAVGNPALRPERTASYEAGLVQEWFRRRLRTEAAAFSSSFRDLIIFTSLPYPQPGTWQNLEAGRARGLEFSSQARIASWLAVSGAYTRMWTRVTRSSSPNSPFTGVGQELPRRAGNSGAASVSLTPPRFAFQAGAIFVGERQDPDQYMFGVNRNRGYQNLYAAGSLRLAKRVSPFFRAENLLDQSYQEVLGYPALRRNIHGGLRFEW